MQNKLISIIVPIYNVEQYLRKCVDSILVQTYENLEIILVDDGSPDDCGLICDEYAQQDSRIKVIHQENGGLSVALNSGLDAATGEYIGFVDSDDWIEPNMYECLLGVMEETGSDIVQCVDFVDNDTSLSTIEKTTKEFNSSTISGLNSILESFIDYLVKVSKCLNLYSSTIFIDLRFSIGHVSQDVIAFPEIISKCNVFTKIDLELYHRYERRESITRQEKQLVHLKSYEKIIDTFYLVYMDKPELQDLIGFYICRFISNYKRYFSLAESKNITKANLKAHMAALSKVFRTCFKDARKNVRYTRLSRNRRLYWQVFYFTPAIAYRIRKYATKD